MDPGSDLYLVYDQGWDAGGGDFEPTISAAVLKIGWTCRF